MFDTIRSGLPKRFDELAQLGRTRHRHRVDVLACFDYRASRLAGIERGDRRIDAGLETLRRRARRILSLPHCGNLSHAINAL